jgi:uncharacterized protein
MADIEIQRRAWHEGEAAVQRLAGAAPTPVIRTFMSDQMLQFFPQLSLLFMGAVDAEGFPSATFVHGPPGFISCPEPTRLDIGVTLLESDPLTPALCAGAEVGLLGVDFQRRRRNRVNGSIASLEENHMRVAVAEGFGNCARYINEQNQIGRVLSKADRFWTSLDGVDDAARLLIETVETFFIASSARCDWGGVDISHRGGPRGIVEIEADGTIIVPDFEGNGYFNTLGNLRVHPKAGLLFLDFDTEEALRVTGVVEIVWEGAEVLSRLASKRLLKFKPRRVWRLKR